MQQPLRIGTRGSRLALWQANWVRDQILAGDPDLHVELLVIKTEGDRILNHSLAKFGGKGLFVKELENAIIRHQVDLAVHSMKDVPAILPEELEISIIPSRDIPDDGLIAHRGQNLDSLPEDAVVGTSSLRRAAQLLAYRADLRIKNLRGNVDTRLNKVLEGDYEAAVMAVAGLKRLGLEKHITQSLPYSIMLPAIAQGALGIETRKGDEQTLSFLHHLHDPDTAHCVRAERAVLTSLAGNCNIPLAGFCAVHHQHLKLTALLATPDGSRIIRRQATAPYEQATQLGKKVAQQILEEGGREILASLSYNL